MATHGNAAAEQRSIRQAMATVMRTHRVHKRRLSDRGSNRRLGFPVIALISRHSHIDQINRTEYLHCVGCHVHADRANRGSGDSGKLASAHFVTGVSSSSAADDRRSEALLVLCFRVRSVQRSPAVVRGIRGGLVMPLWRIGSLVVLGCRRCLELALVVGVGALLTLLVVLRVALLSILWLVALGLLVLGVHLVVEVVGHGGEGRRNKDKVG